MKKLSWIPQTFMLLGLLALIFFAFSLLVFGKGSSESPANGYSANLIKSTKTFWPLEDEEKKQEIADYKTKIADKNLPSEAEPLMKTRLAFAEKRATALAKEPDPNFTDVPETPDPINGKGIEHPDGPVRGAPVPWSASKYTINSVWKGKNGNEKILIYAGARTEDKDQGIVIVRILKSSQDFFYPTPKKAGAILITDYDGAVVTLISEQGETFKFDVGSGLYLDYPEPTVTPTIEPVVVPPPTAYP